MLTFFLLINLSCSKFKVSEKYKSHYPAQNWTMYGGNPGRTNYYPGKLNLPLKFLWQHNASAAIGKALIVQNGILYFSTMDGRVGALNILTGKKQGDKKFDLHSTTVVKDTTLIIARRYGDHTLFNYNLKRGKIQWQFNAGDIASEPLILDDKIVITARYNHIDLYDLTDGTEIWKFETDDQIQSSPACQDSIIVFGCDNHFIYAVHRLNGELLWEFKTGASVQSIPSIKDSVVYIGSQDLYFYALNLHSGDLIWKFKAEGQILHGSAVHDSVVIFSSTLGGVYCLNRFNGQMNWSFKAESVVSTLPLICDEKVFFGSLDKHYYALDIANGNQLWSYKTKGRARTAPVIWKNYVLGASEDNHIYAFISDEVN